MVVARPKFSKPRTRLGTVRFSRATRANLSFEHEIALCMAVPLIRATRPPSCMTLSARRHYLYVRCPCNLRYACKPLLILLQLQASGEGKRPAP